MIRTVTVCVCWLLVGAAFADDQAEVRKIVSALAPGQSAMLGELRVTMHQKGGGAPDKDGWYAAESLASGFKVRLPVPFSELSMLGPTADGGKTFSVTIAGKSSEGCRFTAVCMTRVDRQMDPVDVDNIIRSVAEGARKAETRDIVQAGFVGRELTMTGATGTHLLARFLGGRGWACQLMAEYPPSESEYMPSVALRFAGSFRAPVKAPK